MLRISCFGEVLWDVFPSYRRIGGAPLNVALRLHRLGAEVYMVSRLGKDPEGEEILSYIREQGLSDDLIQLDEELPTGTVDVHLDEHRTATYTINKPVAWDNIASGQEIGNAIRGSDALIFGSLVCRSERSEKTLLSLIDQAAYKIFDLNLRPPHYKLSKILLLMQEADLIKMNDEEIGEVCSFLKLPGNTVRERMKTLSGHLDKKVTLCVTKGPDGAELLREGILYENPGYKVKVADTVGAGDSFLAALSFHLLSGTAPQKALDIACAMGTLVAGKEGANPMVTKEEIERRLNP
jgi:fructokinase